MSSIFLPEIFLGNANLICVLWRQIPGLIPLPSWGKITCGFPTPCLLIVLRRIFIKFIETPEALADKPDCPLIGADGNIFNLLGIASRTLREHGLKEQAKEMSDRVFASGSYGEALCIIGEYVNITDSEPEHKNSLRQQLKATKPADPVKKQQTSKQQER